MCLNPQNANRNYNSQNNQDGSSFPRNLQKFLPDYTAPRSKRMFSPYKM
jgi:hypothetical protein